MAIQPHSRSPVPPVLPNSKAQPAAPARTTPLAAEERVQSYNVTVETGDMDGQGTDANVYITLHGSEGKSKRTLLREDPSNFEVGAVGPHGPACYFSPARLPRSAVSLCAGAIFLALGRGQ
jgi:hypothetical protein